MKKRSEKPQLALEDLSPEQDGLVHRTIDSESIFANEEEFQKKQRQYLGTPGDLRALELDWINKYALRSEVQAAVLTQRALGAKGNFGEVANANEYYRAKITGDELSRQRPAAVRQREREEKRAAAKGWQDF